MNSLLIFSEKNSPRLNYICRLIFTRHLGLDWTVTTDKQAFETYEGAKIGYSAIPSDAPLRIHPVSLLFETGVQVQHIETGIFNGVTVPFKTAGGALPFDLLAAVFYLVSRYEEYLPFEPNQYGQFKAADSLAYKLGFLNKPVVDTWITALKDALQKQFPFLRFRQKRFATTFTYDIDVAYAYKGRSIFTNAGAAIKDLLSLHFKDIAQRFSVLNGSMKDPFDTYDAILEQQKNCGHNLLFFFLLGPKNKYNRNLHPYKKELQQLVRRITAAANTGIHPSYFANDDYLQLQHEKLLLETIAQKKITCSRQHYLRLVFPHTYLHLMKAGITDDYTLGFAEMPGFRAGTCSAFPFYNLLTEEETALLLHPNTFMEGTFMEDMQLKPDAALPLMKQLAEEVKNVNGHFISIWHNHSLSNKKQWAGLKEVHDSLADFAAAYKNP